MTIKTSAHISFLTINTADFLSDEVSEYFYNEYDSSNDRLSLFVTKYVTGNIK